jgi:hypothetical protein
VLLKGLGKLEKIHLIGTRTLYLPACSIVSLPTTLPRAPKTQTKAVKKVDRSQPMRRNEEKEADCLEKMWEPGRLTTLWPVTGITLPLLGYDLVNFPLEPTYSNPKDAGSMFLQIIGNRP